MLDLWAYRRSALFPGFGFYPLRSPPKRELNGGIFRGQLSAGIHMVIMKTDIGMPEDEHWCACVLLASGGCTGLHKFAFLA